jgi:hypothetical protein
MDIWEIIGSLLSKADTTGRNAVSFVFYGGALVCAFVGATIDPDDREGSIKEDILLELDSALQELIEK